jgi:hypothetical protein
MYSCMVLIQKKCIAAWYITGVDYDLSSLSLLYSMWKKIVKFT